MGEADVVARDGADIVDFCLENRQRHCIGMLGNTSYICLRSQLLEPRILMKGSCG